MKKTLIKFSVCLFLFFILALPSEAAPLGQQVLFYVDSSFDSLSRSSLTATLQKESDKAYFYAENAWWDSLSSTQRVNAQTAITNLADEFDERIYPQLTGAFGSIWNPGIDGDPKVTILISRLRDGAAGYFNSADEYPRSLAPSSNQREMIYLGANYLSIPRAKGFLAHEFQHLITFYQKEKLRAVSEDIWLNEARSEYVSTLLGYDNVLLSSNFEKRLSDFLGNPNDSLTEWPGSSLDYGPADLFMQYLVDHFGHAILVKMMESPNVGIASIEDALRAISSSKSFLDIFVDWSVANYLNNCQIAEQNYCYLNNIAKEKFHVSPTISQVFSFSSLSSESGTDFIKDWSGFWHKISGAEGNLKFDFQGEKNGIFKVVYLIEKTDGSFELKNLSLDSSNKGSFFVQNLGKDVKSVVLIPISIVKKSNFGSLETSHQFSYQASLIKESVPPDTINPPVLSLPNYADGSLIRAKGDYKVYIIKGGYKRWIQSSEIFNFYPHFGWLSIIEVTPQELALYKDAWLMRADGDPRVYEVNGDGTKHWLNMTAEQFSLTGRKWDMVYIINKQERDWYKLGADVMFR